MSYEVPGRHKRRIFLVRILLVFASVLFSTNCGLSSRYAGPDSTSVPVHFSVKNASVTPTPPTSITFNVICNSLSMGSEILNMATSSGVVVQNNQTCTLDMTSFVTSGTTYTPASTDLIITISNMGAVTSNATSAALKYSYGGSSDLYFIAGPNSASTSYTVVMDYATDLSQLLFLLPSNFVVNNVANPAITGITYSYANPSPTTTTSLTLSAANTNAPAGNPACVVIKEASASAPANQLLAATQYIQAASAIYIGTTNMSSNYGNSCASSNTSYCNCPSAFNSTTIGGAGNWDIFYTNNQVIIWIDYDPNSPNGSAYTTLDVPAAP